MARAGRKPLNSALFMKVRSQVILRATADDIENRTDVVRLAELCEQYKSDESLNKFVMKALLNQMKSDELGSRAGSVANNQVQHTALVVDPVLPQSTPVEPQLTIHPAPAPAPAQELPRIAPEPVMMAVQTQPTAEMIIESTLQSLEAQNSEGQAEVTQRPKRRMGGNALRAMGSVT